MQFTLQQAYIITLQEQYTKHELCQNMAETLVATTKERLYRHSHEYNWTISYLEHTDKNKVFLITKKIRTSLKYG